MTWCSQKSHSVGLIMSVLVVIIPYLGHKASSVIMVIVVLEVQRCRRRPSNGYRRGKGRRRAHKESGKENRGSDKHGEMAVCLVRRAKFL
jgi:hypothetical protein